MILLWDQIHKEEDKGRGVKWTSYF
jgi:hypothetical protein